MINLKNSKLSFSAVLGLEHKTKPKLPINVGACLDIPTGELVTGRRGETIILGGLATIDGMVGPGNNYKSTIQKFKLLSAANRVMEGVGGTAIMTYDTEVNISLDRLENLANRFPYLPKNIIVGEDALWTVTDKSMIAGDDFIDKIFKYMEEKSKSKDLVVKYECFKDPYSDKEYEAVIPTFGDIDSFSELEAKSTSLMLSNDLDSSDTNTYAMKQGAFKTKVLSQLPRLTSASNTYLSLTAQIGEKIDMATGPAKYNQPTRKLQYLKTSDTIKGVSSKFTFLLLNGWMANTASKLINPTTKQPEYPINNSIDSISTDLNVVRLTQLRGKFGPSGIDLELVVSQDEGVLPTMTEFHNIKEDNRFGISGSNVSYSLDLFPDVSLSRTTVRGKIDNDNKLRRAINITSEINQLLLFKRPRLEVEDLICTPKELYQDLKDQGYDWNMILQTREYWTINQYSNPRPFLSSMDLLRMRKKLYFPYFLNEDKTIKKEYKEFEEQVYGKK